MTYLDFQKIILMLIIMSTKQQQQQQTNKHLFRGKHANKNTIIFC